MDHRPLSRDEGAADVLDYPRLVALLAVAQATSRTGATACTMPLARPAWSRAEALTAVARAEPAWPQAALSLGSSFHPAVAERTRDMDAKGS